MTHNPDPLAQLLRSAGARATAPADRASRGEATVRVEWQAAVQKRIVRRRAAWVAASCLTSAALIALMLHAHVGQVAPQDTMAPVSVPRPAHTVQTTVPRDDGSSFRANNEDRPPDRGLPSHVLAHYAWDTR